MSELSTLFESEADAVEFIGSRLSRRLPGAPERHIVDWHTALASGVLTDQVEVTAAAPDPFAAPAMFRKFRYVVRDDDLNLVETLMDGLVALIPTGLLFPVAAPEAAATGVVTVVIQGVKLLKRVRARGAKLDKKSFSLVTVLETNGPMSFESFLLLMRAMDPTWTAAALTKTLNELAAYPSRDGTAVAFVAVSEDGRWRTSGL